jgi:hypothetical protein
MSSERSFSSGSSSVRVTFDERADPLQLGLGRQRVELDDAQLAALPREVARPAGCLQREAAGLDEHL